MVQELINLLPRDPGTLGLIVAVIGSVIGAGMWLLGARYSRPIFTLLAVLIGAAAGIHFPRWFGWQISGAGPAVGMALILGLTGYALHGMWVGIGFGTVLASWAAVGCWIVLRRGANWNWPAVDADTTVISYGNSLWQSLPDSVIHILPYACGAAMVTGIAMAIIWPKFSLIAGWSLAGTTLLVGMGIAAIEYGRPEWLGKIPSPIWAQSALVGALAVLSCLLQWKLSPKPAISKSVKKSKKDQPDDES